MKKFSTILLLALVALAGCAKQEGGSVVAQPKGVTTIEASAAHLTKLSINTNDASTEDVLTWKNGDRIRFFQIGYMDSANPDKGYQIADQNLSIYFVLSAGAGTSSGTFVAESTNKGILDPKKKYVAFHAGDMTRITSSGAIISVNGFGVATNNVNYIGNKEWAEDKIVIRANVESDGENILPLKFQNDLMSMFEFQISTKDAGSPFNLSSIVMNVGANLIVTNFTFYLDKNLNYLPTTAKAYANVTYNLTNMAKITNIPTIVRIPIFIRPTGMEAARDVSFTLYSDAGKSFAVTKNKGSATEVIFPAGKTYIVPLVTTADMN